MFKKRTTSAKLKEATEDAIKTFNTTINALRKVAASAAEEKSAVMAKRKELEEEENNLDAVANEATQMADAISRMIKG